MLDFAKSGGAFPFFVCSLERCVMPSSLFFFVAPSISGLEKNMAAGKEVAFAQKSETLHLDTRLRFKCTCDGLEGIHNPLSPCLVTLKDIAAVHTYALLLPVTDRALCSV